MRAGLLGPAVVAALTAVAAAQVDAPGSFPIFSAPLDRPQSSETYRRLPVRDMGNEIRIEVNADLLYSFEDAKVRASASDLLTQAANLIYERAKSPVRIECRSDRTPPAAAQKLADACAAALMQYLVKEEKVTNVKFAGVGVTVPPPAPPDPRDPFAPLPPRQTKVLIVFGKK
jgi:outer membrane protein OmpA-like peptidoglycan-associated protein